MAYTLEFDLSGDNNGTGGTSTVAVHIDVDGVSTSLGTATSPVDSAPGLQWGAQSFDVTGVFDPTARDVVVRWTYSSGADAGQVRNLRITDGTDEWLDQWGHQANTWDSAGAWAIDGGSAAPIYHDWYKFPSLVSMGNAFGTGFVHHLIRTQTTGSWVLKFDVAPDSTATGGSSHISRIHVYMDVDGVTTDLGLATSPTESGNDGTFEFGDWSMNVDGVFDPAAAEVTVRWIWDSTNDTAHIRYVRVESFDGATVYHDQFGDWYGLLTNAEVAYDGSGSPRIADPCGPMPTGPDLASATVLIDPEGDGYNHHQILPTFRCPQLVVGYLQLG